MKPIKWSDALFFLYSMMAELIIMLVIIFVEYTFSIFFRTYSVTECNYIM